MRSGSRYSFARFLGGFTRLRAFGTRTKHPQEVPRINPVLMAIVPAELDRVLAYSAGVQRLHCRLEHRQGSGGLLLRIARLTLRLHPLLVAESTRTGIAQIPERVMTPVSVLPLDVHPLSGGKVDIDALRVGGSRNSWRRYRHTSSIA